jgi:hypothetical protein
MREKWSGTGTEAWPQSAERKQRTGLMYWFQNELVEAPKRYQGDQISLGKSAQNLARPIFAKINT